MEGSGGGNKVVTVVNGNSQYNARTTRRALGLLFERHLVRFDRLELEQSVEVPIGAGFGASAASAISAVYAAAGALGLEGSKSELARCAHDAEIMEQTGLGTVSVTYDATGAGAIIRPGIPGVAQFLNVKVSARKRLVTANLAPFEKRDAYSSPEMSRRIVKLGDEALRRVLADPTLEDLAAAGEWFSENLGLASDRVRRLIHAAKSVGASHSSQNMIGHAIHSIVDEDLVEKVVRALLSTGLEPRVDVFEIGTVKAGLF